MKKILLSIVSVAFLFVLTGCGKTDPIIGTWTGDSADSLNTTFTFEKNGNCKYENEYGANDKGSYEINESKITISLDSWSKEKVYDYEINGDTLTLTATDLASPSYPELKKK